MKSVPYSASARNRVSRLGVGALRRWRWRFIASTSAHGTFGSSARWARETESLIVLWSRSPVNTLICP